MQPIGIALCLWQLRLPSILAWGLGVPAEEAVGLPLRPLAAVGNASHQSPNQFLILRSSCQIYRLFKVVGRSVISVGKPISE